MPSKKVLTFGKWSKNQCNKSFFDIFFTTLAAPLTARVDPLIPLIMCLEKIYFIEVALYDQNC